MSIKRLNKKGLWRVGIVAKSRQRLWGRRVSGNVKGVQAMVGGQQESTIVDNRVWKLLKSGLRFPERAGSYGN